MTTRRRLFATHLGITLSIHQDPETAGFCIHCGQQATKEALFREDGFVIREKYCDSCIMDPEKFKEILRFHDRLMSRG